MLAAACSLNRSLLVTKVMSTVDVFVLHLYWQKNDLELELELELEHCYNVGFRLVQLQLLACDRNQCMMGCY